MKSFKTTLSLLPLVFFLLLANCCKEDRKKDTFSLEGAWTLTQIEYPMGGLDCFPQDETTLLRIYDGDSVLYQCRLMQTASALVVHLYDRRTITMIDEGGGERLYLENDNPHPLNVINDSTIVVQINGTLYTWHRDELLDKEWGTEIRSIAYNALKVGNDDEMGYFVLSAKEREQATVISWLMYAIIAFVIMMSTIVLIAIANRRAKRRLQLQLQQIQEEHNARPQSVKRAILTEESVFFTSDDYQVLQRRIATGDCLNAVEWNTIEEQLKRVYPGFTSQLRNLYPMSELEYQTCLLIKLRIMPTDIAAVLARDISTISTVRSRLYKKVFGEKGGAKEWDDFILSIGV